MISANVSLLCAWTVTSTLTSFTLNLKKLVFGDPDHERPGLAAPLPGIQAGEQVEMALGPLTGVWRRNQRANCAGAHAAKVRPKGFTQAARRRKPDRHAPPRH